MISNLNTHIEKGIKTNARDYFFTNPQFASDSLPIAVISFTKLHRYLKMMLHSTATYRILKANRRLT